jgi:phage terminase small subunit
MAGKRRPMDINLSIVDSRKHWTKAEIESRKDSEPRLPKPKALTPPKWLSKEAQTAFRRYTKLLLDFPEGVVSKLDAGTLARYCDCEASYAEASKHKSVWLEIASQRLSIFSDMTQLVSSASDIQKAEASYDEAKAQMDFWSGQMVKFEKMARSCASEMGMTVSSRCRLVVPRAESRADDNPLAALQRRFAD